MELKLVGRLIVRNTKRTFNRTIVELKRFQGVRGGYVVKSFNRTIVELKRLCDCPIRGNAGAFNRTIVELKRKEGAPCAYA